MFQQFGPEQLPDLFFSSGGEARMVLILNTWETVGRISLGASIHISLSGNLNPCLRHNSLKRSSARSLARFSAITSAEALGSPGIRSFTTCRAMW